ncbi:Teichoic acid glycosylation protein [Paucilactobacillus wasatchensis]|uniref:Teichoic acid glycosylation protein n=2 Tax=Paucilactobacillus wasatchensis TaxID=1335616 RepID=A0A0D1A722_9LACO|nr:Teichoic acid glycosylation protein [Paucilactobacillus wasatchensis]
MVTLFKKYQSMIAYIFFGGVTTLVNLGVFAGLDGLHWNYQLANVIAWFLSVLVAYLTNKVWVFSSHYTTVKAFIVEFLEFYFFRALTLIIDIIILYIGISLLHWNALVVKLIDNVLVVIVNYVFSKWYIFKTVKK